MRGNERPEHHIAALTHREGVPESYKNDEIVWEISIFS